MGRRLKQRELLDLIDQTQDQLEELRPHYPLPSADQGREPYLHQLAAGGLLRGRLYGLSEASGAILHQRRWGPVSQARAHDALLEASSRAWTEREAEQGQLRALSRTYGYQEQDLAAVTMRYTGQLDALQAVSQAIAGYPARLLALTDIEHPERARRLTRDRERDRGRG